MKLSRLNAIEQYILSKGAVTVEELCETFEVSKNTIRRDLNELEARGYVSKVYGGVTAHNPQGIIPVPERIVENSGAKQLIGQLASRFVADGDSIFIDSGTTAHHIIPNIQNKKNITVIANCLTVLKLATKQTSFSVISLGGFYSAPTDSFVGISAYESLEGLRINKAFMACTGISVNAGFTNNSYLDAEIKRGIVSRSNFVYVLADSSKFGREATLSFCPLERISAIVTETMPNNDVFRYCMTNNIEIVTSN